MTLLLLFPQPESAITLSIADAFHSQTADNLSLTQHQLLVIANSLHAQTTDNLSLTQHQLLVIANSLHAQLADNVILSIPGAPVVDTGAGGGGKATKPYVPYDETLILLMFARLRSRQ